MKKVILATLAFAPALVFAENLSELNTLVGSIGNIVEIALPIVVGIALLTFFWGLVRFIFAQGNEETKQEAKKIMIWGIIALFVMITIWGLVEFIASNLGIDQDADISVPKVPGI